MEQGVTQTNYKYTVLSSYLHITNQRLHLRPSRRSLHLTKWLAPNLQWRHFCNIYQNQARTSSDCRYSPRQRAVTVVRVKERENCKKPQYNNSNTSWKLPLQWYDWRHTRTCAGKRLLIYGRVVAGSSATSDFHSTMIALNGFMIYSTSLHWDILLNSGTSRIQLRLLRQPYVRCWEPSGK